MAKPIVNNGSPTSIQPVKDAGSPAPNAGTGLATGDNGFPIDGQKYTYDTGAAGNGGSQGTYVRGVNVDPAYLNPDGTPQDLKPATLLTLAQFLSKQTMGGGDATSVPNKYPVSPPTSFSAPTFVSTTGKDGNPSPLELPPQNSNTFAGGAEATFDYPTSQYPALAPQIKKGRAAGSGVDGNDLLAGVPGTGTYTANPGNLSGDGTSPKPLPGHSDTSGVINSYTSAVMANNRFTSAAAAYASSVTDPTDPGAGYDPALTQQGKLGEFDKNAPTVTIGRLATIGPLLGLRATTTLGATNPGADPNSGGMEAAALLPGLAQLGAATIDQHRMLASDILSSLTTNEAPSSNTLSVGTQSWGQLNNVNDPFSGTDALGMLTLSIALVAAIELIFDALSIIMGFVTPQLKTRGRDDQGRYTLGEYYPGSKSTASVSSGGPLGALSALASLNFGSLLGINPTNYPLSSALSHGLNAFFGLPQSSGAGITIGLNLTSSSDSPGFNVTVARSIIRGFVIIGQSLSKIGGNPMNVINAILSMIDTIRASKVIAAINVFAMMGDAILSQNPKFVDDSSPSGLRVSEMDSIDNDLASAMNKSRLQGTLKLAWASNRAPANYLIPASILGMSAIVRMGQINPYAGGFETLSKAQTTVTTTTTGPRIDPADVATFEQQLDGEYVPFSFQDIRTNEIISFHAFLTGLNEDFNAAYEKVDGFGRVEPVKIYKSTDRRITMSFIVAATGPNDFEEMWVKLNKLVTLMYPQYTQGLQMSDQTGQYVFTQPFSQLIGGTPLVRIRLGDLLKSNYSQFALARLFGLGNSNFMVGGQQFQDLDKFNQDSAEKVFNALEDALTSPNGETYFVAPGSYKLAPPSSAGGMGLPTPPLPSPLGGGSQGPKNPPEFNPSVGRAGGCEGGTILTVTAKGIDSDTNMMIATVGFSQEPDAQEVMKGFIQKLTQRLQDPDDPLGTVIGGDYLFPLAALTATPATQAAITQKVFQASADPFVNALTDFVNPTAQNPNAIAKSFNDTGGKGLAGVIESMAFDWFDNIPWETELGKTAPKMCKINLTFSPIHDISPGIDHMGFNRAPIWPVARMNQTGIPPAAGS